MECKMCDGCVVNCACPRCPKNPDRVICPICGDTCQCSCATILTTHFQNISEPFCQICVEDANGFKLTHQLLGMYCDDHAAAAITRLGKQMPRYTNE